MSIRAQPGAVLSAPWSAGILETHGILELDSQLSPMALMRRTRAPGAVIDFRVPIEIGGARIQPGDILFGDVDGVCVVPKAAEEEVFVRALEKARGEKRVRKAIEDGMSTKEAFETFGIM